MNVLITGATGFIGAALCRELLEYGHTVTAVVRPESKHINKIPNGIQIVELALEDISEMTGRFDLCYHLAWNGSAGEMRHDFDVQLSNIKYTVDTMRCAKKLGCHKFIGAGSQAEYGVVHSRCREDMPTDPFMMYGAAKLSTYHMSKIVAEQEGISFVWPRIYSVYGVGENQGTLISYLMDCFWNHEPAELSSCDNMWDFMYITDCVKALRMLGENSNTSGIYNVSTGTPALLKQFVNRARQVIDPSAEIRFGVKQTDCNRTFWLEPDVQKLQDIGFECTIGFEEGIRKKWNNKVKNKCVEL